MIVDFARKGPDQWMAVDPAHCIFLFGTVLARKPHDVLDLGIGTCGYTSRLILQALKYNQRGRLTCVDNWLGFGGSEQEVARVLRSLGAEVVRQAEEDYVKGCPDDSFDLLVSDADHDRSHLWVKDHMRITRHDGFMFFHDTNNRLFPNLHAIESEIKHLPYFHFKESTRPDEECERGWLFAVNKKC